MLAMHTETPWGNFPIKKPHLYALFSLYKLVYIISKLALSLKCNITWYSNSRWQINYNLHILRIPKTIAKEALTAT